MCGFGFFDWGGKGVGLGLLWGVGGIGWWWIGNLRFVGGRVLLMLFWGGSWLRGWCRWGWIWFGDYGVGGWGFFGGGFWGIGWFDGYGIGCFGMGCIGGCGFGILVGGVDWGFDVEDLDDLNYFVYFLFLFFGVGGVVLVEMSFGGKLLFNGIIWGFFGVCWGWIWCWGCFWGGIGGLWVRGIWWGCWGLGLCRDGLCIWCCIWCDVWGGMLGWWWWRWLVDFGLVGLDGGFW